MPQVILWALGALGAVAIGKWLAREAHRINAELDAVKAPPVDTASDRPSLKRDPQTGIYRPKA